MKKGCVAQYANSGEEKTTLKTMEETVTKNGSFPQSPDGVFPAYCDGELMEDVTVTGSDDSRISSCFRTSNVDSAGSQLCGNDPILCDRYTAVDNVYQYPLTHVNQTKDDLNLFNNENEDKTCSDLLYYGWPDIGNFEDVDKMFSCDSTFSLESVSNGGDLCWFLSSNDNVVDPSSKLSCSNSSVMDSMTDCLEASRLHNASLSVDGCDKKSVGIETSFHKSDVNQPAALHHLPYANGSNTVSDSKDGLMPKEKISLHEKQSKQQVEKGKECFLENDDFNNLKDAHIHHMQFDYAYQSDHIPACLNLPGSKCEHNTEPSGCPWSSSSLTNQVQQSEGSCPRSFQAPAIRGDLKRVNPCNGQGLQDSFNSNTDRGDLVAQVDPDLSQKQLHVCENDVEGHSEVGGVSIGGHAELSHSNIQESSCKNSSDKISLEATSFHQLQHVIEQLDARTKLCIRDSLYRLASSADLRHTYAKPKDGSKDKDTTAPLVAGETNRSTRFMDVETDTNPIDRSIAHLLFHRPSDQLANDASHQLSYAMNSGSSTSPPVLVEKALCKEEAADGGEEMSLITDDKN